MTNPISQVDANNCFKTFFESNGNNPVKYSVLATELKNIFKANPNQISGLIHRAHAKDKILIKDGKNYCLNTKPRVELCDFSTLKKVKNRIFILKNEIEKSISIGDLNDEKEFLELKEILEMLESIYNSEK